MPKHNGLKNNNPFLLTKNIYVAVVLLMWTHHPWFSLKNLN